MCSIFVLYFQMAKLQYSIFILAAFITYAINAGKLNLLSVPMIKLQATFSIGKSIIS